MANDGDRFAYTFDNLTNVVSKLVDRLGIGKFSMCVMDYGAPIGYRLALRRPDRIEKLVIQNGNAYEEVGARVGLSGGVEHAAAAKVLRDATHRALEHLAHLARLQVTELLPGELAILLVVAAGAPRDSARSA
jgi:pimeloyl-ACP methyl ester carboxylesterase